MTPRTEFDHNGFRNYSPATGKYLQTDPMVGGLLTGTYYSMLDGTQSLATNPYSYAYSGPTLLSDKWGLDVWIERRSGNEGPGHQSINIGDPVGVYVSVGYALALNRIPKGAVYIEKRADMGGRILKYARSTREEDTAMLRELYDAVAHQEWKYYGPFNNCITYTEGNFSKFVQQYGLTPTPPPPRIDKGLSPLGEIKTIAPFIATTITGIRLMP